MFWCPGCDHPHGIKFTMWTWNQDAEKPTFSPSLLSTGGGKPDQRCHLFVKEGNLEFLNDSTHHLAGKTVPIPDWPYSE